MRYVWLLIDFGANPRMAQSLGTFVFSGRELAEAFVSDSLTGQPLVWERSWCSSQAYGDATQYSIEVLRVDDDGSSWDGVLEQARLDVLVGTRARTD